MKSYRKKLDQFHPVGFEKNINWQQVMAVWVVSDEIGILRKRSAIGSFLRAIKEAFYDSFKYEVSKEKNFKALCFYGRYNYRADHYKTFSTLVTNLENVGWMKAVSCSPQKHIGRGIALTGRILVWFFQALGKRMNPIQAANVVYPVTLCYLLQNDLKEILKNEEMKVFIAYYDVSPDENFAVQMAKNYGKVTATLQHGIFAPKNPCRVLSDTAFEYSESIADYYLAWNQYTCDEWIKMGLNPKRIKVVGIPKYINAENLVATKREERNIFGIMLNNSSFNEHNIRLIQMGNEVALKTGKKYVIRYHPELKDGAYEEYIRQEFFAGKSDNRLSILEYAQLVDFTIISSSSVFVDLIYLNQPVYRLKVYDNDTYANVDFNSFAKLEELLGYLQGEMNNQEIFEYLCTTNKVREAYQFFINDTVEESMNEDADFRNKIESK